MIKWTPATNPPDDNRDVLIAYKNKGELMDHSIGCYDPRSGYWNIKQEWVKLSNSWYWVDFSDLI